MAAVRASGSGTPPLLEVFGETGGELQLLARRRAARSDDGWTVTIWADGIIACRLSGSDMRICVVCFGIGQKTSGWQRLHEEPILTPVVAAGTENTAANVHGADATRAEAYGRLAVTLGRETRDELAEAFATGGLGEVVEVLVRTGRHTVLPPDATEAAGARMPPQLGMASTQLVALTALDPDVARMLGLLYHDPVESGTYDYKVVAHHGDARHPSRLVTFDSLPAGPLDAATAGFAGVAFVGTAGLEVLAPGTDGRTKLRVAAPRIGTASGIRFDPPVPAVTVRLDVVGAVPLAAWRGSQQVDSAVPFFDVALLEDAGGIDAITWSTGPVDLVELEIYEDTGTLGDVAAYAWRLSPTTPAPVHELELTEVAAAAEPARLHPDGTVDAGTSVVGLDWGESSPVQDAGRPVRAHAGRAATATDPLEVRNADQPAPAFADRRRSVAAPDVPRRWFERAVGPGTSAWSVRGIDAFGRLGAWAQAREVNVPAGTVPPPPDGVEAAYLDPADPLLDDERRALVERDGPGLLVQWTWPAERRVAAPGVEPEGEFRVYVRRGDPNVLEGTVRSVTDLGDRSRLTTDLALRGSLAGERLRVNGTSFPVLSNASGDGAAIEVAHLSAPVARPSAGAFTVHLSEASPLRTDLALPRGFGELVHVVPVGSPPRLTAGIVAVGADGAVTLDRPLPAPDGLLGRLVAGGIAYKVLGQSAGSERIAVAAAVQPNGSLVLPSAGERCTVWCGAAYRAWLPGVGATPRTNERLALTLAGVSTCDVTAVILHDPVPPGPRTARPRRGEAGPGLEGPLSRIARVSVPHRDPPPAVPVDRPPEQDGDIPADRAEPADWYGRARYDLAFSRISGATGYRVGRASVAALSESDRAARQAGAAPYADGPFDDGGASETWLREHHPSVAVEDLTAESPSSAAVAAWRDWSAWFYPQRLNRELMALAELPCNEEALRPAHAGTIAGPPFADELDGRGLGRFAYRVRSVDASGNASAWSAAFPLVEVHDITPPAIPSITAALSAQNAVVLSWRPNREPDLAGYRIWRARSAAELDDVRRRPPHAELAPTAGAVSETWTDALAAGLGARCYRLAAFDGAGNVSAPTAAVAVRPIDTIAPNPTAWLRAERSGPSAVTLAWEGDEGGLECLLERRADRARVWAPLTGWLAPDARGGRRFRHLDGDADPAIRWRYRVRARDAAGNVGPGLVEIVVDAENGG